MPRQKDPDDKNRPPLPSGDRQGKGGKPLSPRERLEALNEALFESQLLDESEFDAADAARADAVIKSAIERSKANPSQAPENERSWAKKDAAKKRNERGGDRQRD